MAHPELYYSFIIAPHEIGHRAKIALVALRKRSSLANHGLSSS